MERLRIRSGLVKALIAACLLAGVFTMHGLTSNHDAAMPLIHQPIAQPAPMAHHAAVPAPSVGLPVVEIGPYEDHGHIHSMEDVCLAMLVALLLALVVALALRSLLTAHPVVLAAVPIRVVADGPSPPWRRPILSKLCVLRT